MRFTKNNIARKILPYAATILSASLVVTLRIEHTCSANPNHDEYAAPRALYPLPELIAAKATRALGCESYEARCVTNFMKSDSASRDGWTSPPSPKNRQKLIMSGCHLTGSMCGRVE